ncbi:MarR family transcriptional regulator [Caldivirga sp.]|uniref:helix-turn-helix transcriptional regulator n=1 Tax=Caldivirga sp. TaxID=2080243 RepID=UPI0025BA112B|nr:MarR family transcriptional regulator [Caldivirga sp.]
MVSESHLMKPALITAGVVILVIAVVILAMVLPMVNIMGYYHCMGMMCGSMTYYPLIPPLILLIVGVLLITIPLTVLKQRNVSRQVNEVSAGSSVNDLLKLLPRQERVVLEYIVKSGGEVYQYQIARDLGLSKVRAWRIIRRLEEKGLVEVVKVKGRNIVKLRK